MRGPINSQGQIGDCLGEGSLTGPKPCLVSGMMFMSPMPKCSAEFVSWHCVRANTQPAQAHLLSGLIILKVQPRQKQEPLDCGTESGALPACSSMERCKHRFFKSMQTHNTNHNMVITLQLF